MQKVHIIIDLYYFYYRYKYIIESGRIRNLSVEVEGKVVDVTYLYYTLKSIESEIAKFKDSDCTVSVCIDSYTDRKVESSDYKSNRVGKLSSMDYFNLNWIERTLCDVGYNIYKEYGSEADDLITGLVKNYHKDFDMTYIFTPDADLLVNLKSDVHIYRFKTNIREHVLYTPDNFEELMSQEYKCRMPYNCIVLYKALCGDKSDKIAGIKGFGAKSFDKLIDSLEKDNFDFRLLSSYNNVETVIKMKEPFITQGDEHKMQEAMESLDLIRVRESDIVKQRPVKDEKIQENKIRVYGERYQFKSLL